MVFLQRCGQDVHFHNVLRALRVDILLHPLLCRERLQFVYQTLAFRSRPLFLRLRHLCIFLIRGTWSRISMACTAEDGQGHRALYATSPGTVFAKSVPERPVWHGLLHGRERARCGASFPSDLQSYQGGKATMAKTVAALSHGPTAAYSAVQDLIDHGFARDTIGVMA